MEDSDNGPLTIASGHFAVSRFTFFHSWDPNLSPM